MGFFFQSLTSVDISVSVYPDSQCTDDVLLNENIWNYLQDGSSGTLAIAITPSGRFTENNSDPSTLNSLTCWTQPGNVTGMAIPERWLSEYPYLFSEACLAASMLQTPTHAIVAVNPLKLSEIIIVPEGRNEAREENIAEILRLLSLSPKLIRRGSVFSLLPPSSDEPTSNIHHNPFPRKFRVVSTEPTLQGYVDPACTRLILLLSNDIPQTPELPVNGSASSGSSESSIESESEDLEIGQNYLENELTNALRPESPRSSDSTSFIIRKPKSLGGSPVIVSWRSLSRQIRETGKDGKVDSESSVFLSEILLSQVGVFDGDWGIVSDEECKRSRLCRLFVQHSGTGLQCSGSPILFENITRLDNSNVRIAIQPSGFGQDPPVPTAHTVTVARIASPYSNDRTYQEFFLQNLQNYFTLVKRLVKKGDLIAIPLHVEFAALDERRKHEGNETHGDLVSVDAPNYSTDATGVVFFKVTNIEFDIVRTQESYPDYYMAATMGELGCWVDSSITKMMQTGVEHSRVIDVSSYLDISVFPPGSLEKLESPQTHGRLARLRELTEAVLHPFASALSLPASILLKGSRGIGKSICVEWLAHTTGIHLLKKNCFDVLGDTDIQTEGTLRALFEKGIACAPCILFLQHIEAFGKTTQSPPEIGKEIGLLAVLSELIDDLKYAWRSNNHPVIVVASTSEFDQVSVPILKLFKHEISLEAPTESERLDLLSVLVKDFSLSPDVSLSNVAVQTAAMVASDLVYLVDTVQTLAMKRTLALNLAPGLTQSDLAHAEIVLTTSDFTEALSVARLSYAESIGAPKIPAVTWDDVGGLASVKSDILDTIQLPLEHPELFADGLKKRSGILLYGPPGTGKTLLAKAVATSCSLNFLSVKGPELLNMYIGESEANVRRIFQKARDAKPCIIFFDELDSIAPKRGNHGDSGGVMDRIVSQLLAELDGMVEGRDSTNVFVIGATNRPDLLDPALLRPGRFDRLLYLGVSDTHEAQFNILQALTRKFPRDPDLNLMDIARLCSFNFTGADFYALCSDAMLKAMSRKAEEIDRKIGFNQQPPPYDFPHPLTPQYYLAELASPSEMEVLVSQKDFEDALNELTPSVSREELAHYTAIQQQFAKAPSENSS